MRWEAKAAVQKAMSGLPRGEEFNYFLQRRVTKRLPVPDSRLLTRVEAAFDHARRYREASGSTDLSGVRAYEFGAGWELIVPMALWTLGVERQVLIDIAPHARLELANHVIGRFERLHDEIEARAGEEVRRVPAGTVGSMDELERRFGIAYRAPRDARATGFDAGSFDLITSTWVLQHVPTPQLAPILAECARLLTPDGVLSCSIDMGDNWSYVDERIGPWNFLRYEERAWRLINSSIHFQNRLRARDYLELFRSAGLEVVEAAPFVPEDDSSLRELELADRFKREYSFEELVPTALDVVARRARAAY